MDKNDYFTYTTEKISMVMIDFTMTRLCQSAYRHLLPTDLLLQLLVSHNDMETYMQTHFTNDFSIVIQIRWKVGLV